MKRQILIWMLVCGSQLGALAQYLPTTATHKPLNVNMEYAKGMWDDELFNQYSLNLGVRVHDYVGLTWNFDLIMREDGTAQWHFPGGPVVGTFVALSVLSVGDIYGAGELFLLALLPDGVTFHIPLNGSWEISPYANVLGFDYIPASRENPDQLLYSGAFGTKVIHYADNRYTSFVFVETRKMEHGEWSYGAGVGLGYLFGSE
jgi:hypothetical protein